MRLHIIHTTNLSSSHKQQQAFCTPYFASKCLHSRTVEFKGTPRAIESNPPAVEESQHPPQALPYIWWDEHHKSLQVQTIKTCILFSGQPDQDRNTRALPFCNFRELVSEVFITASEWKWLPCATPNFGATRPSLGLPFWIIVAAPPAALPKSASSEE